MLMSMSTHVDEQLGNRVQRITSQTTGAAGPLAAHGLGLTVQVVVKARVKPFAKLQVLCDQCDCAEHEAQEGGTHPMWLDGVAGQSVRLTLFPAPCACIAAVVQVNRQLRAPVVDIAVAGHRIDIVRTLGR